MPVLPSSTEDTPKTVGPWADILTVAVPAALLFVFGWKTWQGVPVGVWHDDGAYLLIAESLANGGGLSWFGVSGTPPAAKFPPLYPAFLSLLLRAGVKPESGGAAFALANIGFLSAAGGGFAFFLKRALGFPALVAGLAATVLWLSPRLWALAALPLSEPLFLLALSGALVTSIGVERSLRSGQDTTVHGEDDSPAGTRSTLAGLDFLAAFAAAFYTRTVGIALAPAMVAACYIRGGYRQAILLAAGSVAAILPWIVWSGLATRRIAEPLRDVLGGYGGWLVGEAVRNPFAFVGSTLANLWYAWSVLTTMLIPGLPGHPVLRGVIAIALGAVAVVGLIKLSRHSLTATLFVLFYLATVAVWPFRAPRLIVPLLPLVGIACALALYAAPRPPERGEVPRPPRGLEDWTRWTLMAMGLLLVANYAARSAVDVVAGRHLVPYQVRADALQAAVQSVDEFTTRDDIIGAPELWSGIQIHGNRVVAPSARFLPLATDGPSWGTPAQQFALWAAADLDYIVVEHAGGVHGAALDLLDSECPDGAVQLVALLPTGFLIRLAWDAECRAKLLP